MPLLGVYFGPSDLPDLKNNLIISHLTPYFPDGVLPFLPSDYSDRGLAKYLGAVINHLAFSPNFSRQAHLRLSENKTEILQNLTRSIKVLRNIEPAISAGVVPRLENYGLISSEISTVFSLLSAGQTQLSSEKISSVIMALFSLKQQTAHGRLPLEYPQSPQEMRNLCRIMLDNVVLFFPGCPDYSHNDSRYTFNNLGDSLPLIAANQIRSGQLLVDTLQAFGIPHQALFAVADCEAEDYFAARYTHGDKTEFLHRCYRSAEMVGTKAQEAFGDTPVNSTTFIKLFPSFPELEEAKKQELRLSYQRDPRYRSQIDQDISSRDRLYRIIYPGQNHDFLVERTLRTQAQYQILADLLITNIPNTVMIIHSTVNRRSFSIKGIPVFKMSGKLGEVY